MSSEIVKKKMLIYHEKCNENQRSAINCLWIKFPMMSYVVLTPIETYTLALTSVD